MDGKALAEMVYLYNTSICEFHMILSMADVPGGREIMMFCDAIDYLPFNDKKNDL